MMTIRDVKWVWPTVRSLALTPLYPAFAIASLALAIGGTVGVFAVINRVLTGQQPWRDPGTLVFLEQQSVGSNAREGVWSYPRVRQIQRLARPTFATIAGVGATTVIALEGSTSRAEALKAEFVSPAYFAIVGLPGRVGRLDIGQSGTDPLVVVISDRLWLRYFHRSPAAVGRSLAINGLSLTVVGVAASTFAGVTGGADLWIPLTDAPTLTGEVDALSDSYWAYRVVVRLHSGVSEAQRRMTLAELTGALSLNSAAPRPSRLVVVPPNQALVQARLKVALATLLGAAACLLLLAGANVAALAVVRTFALLPDISIRIALGARERDIIARFALEGSLIALAGTVLGLVVSHWAIVALWAARPTIGSWVRILSTLDRPTVGLRGIGAAVGICVVVAACIVIWPVREVRRQFQGRATLLVGRSRESTRTGRKRSPVRRYLAGFQVALSFVLVQSATLLVSTVVALSHEKVGIQPDGVTLMKLQLPKARYDDRRAAAFYRDLLRQIGALPGVAAVSVDNSLPLEGAAVHTSVAAISSAAHGQSAAHDARYHRVGENHLAALGVRLVAGRSIRTGSLDEGPTEVMINTTAARAFWPGLSPLGQTLASPSLSHLGGDWRQSTVVGMVGDIQYGAPGSPAEPDIYASVVADPPLESVLIVRTRESDRTLWSTVQQTVHDIDPQVLVSEGQAMSDWLAQATSGTRYVARIVVLYAVLAFILAIIGTYSVVAYDVALRKKEFAIARAIGAPYGTILRDVFQSGLRIATWGIIGGLLCTAASARLLSSQLYGVTVLDPWPLIACTVLFALTALFASAVPAIRAIRISPLAALAS